MTVVCMLLVVSPIKTVVNVCSAISKLHEYFSVNRLVPMAVRRSSGVLSSKRDVLMADDDKVHKTQEKIGV